LKLGEIYENALQAAKETLGLVDPAPKTITRRVLRLDQIADSLLSLPTSLEFMDAVNPFLFKIPLRLGIDSVPCMGYPSPLIRDRTRRYN